MFDFIQGYQQAVQAFAKREYATCAREIERILAMRTNGANHQILQMLFISLQRLGDDKAINQLESQALEAMHEHPWARALLQLTLGKTNLKSVLPEASDDEARCRAYFYGGMRLQFDGQAEAAREAFNACVAIQAQCQEWYLARNELEVMRRGDVEKCVQAFLRRDYLNCAVQANDLMANGPPNLGLVQMLVISLLRLGETGTAEDLAGRILSMMSPPPWDTALIRLTLGHTNLPQVLPQAHDDRDRSQAHYYAGSRFLTLGQDEPAREEFEACLALDVPSPERRLAQAEVEPLMRRALSIAEKCHGGEHPEVAIRLQKLAALLQATSRFSEAAELKKREIGIYAKFGRETCKPHPNLGQAFGSYVQMQQQQGLSPEQINAKVLELGREFGISLAVL